MKWTKKQKQQALCVISGLLLWGAACLGAGDGGLTEGYLLRRGMKGEGVQQYSLEAEGIGREKIPVVAELEERAYKREEARAVYRQLLSELPQRILGENASIKEVRTNLNLITSVEELGVSLSWHSEDPELIDSFGTVCNEDLDENGKTVLLQVRMTDGLWPEEYELSLQVLPPLLTETERLAADLNALIAREEERGREEEWLRLPDTLKGQPVTYREKKENEFWILPVLGIVGAVLLEGKEREDEKRHEKQRRQQMLLDYSEVLSRLIIFLGAGMSIRTAWCRITGDYRRAVEQGRRKKRHIYEEMDMVSSQLASGVPEGRAFEEFGRRCGLQPYMKLSGLLEQSRKNGSKNLRDTLKLEMADAFEQRKQQARRLGEEAGTKLLLPLFMLLSVVMVMIAVPALMGFQG